MRYTMSETTFDCGYGRMSQAILKDGEPIIYLDPSESEYAPAISDDNAKAVIDGLNCVDRLRAERNFLLDALVRVKQEFEPLGQELWEAIDRELKVFQAMKADMHRQQREGNK